MKIEKNIPKYFVTDITVKKTEDGEPTKTEIHIDKSGPEIRIDEFQYNKTFGDISSLYRNLLKSKKEYIMIDRISYRYLEQPIFWIHKEELKKLIERNLKCVYFNHICSNSCYYLTHYFSNVPECSYRRKYIKQFKRLLKHEERYIKSVKSYSYGEVTANLNFKINVDLNKKVCGGAMYRKGYKTKIDAIILGFKKLGYEYKKENDEYPHYFTKKWYLDIDSSSYQHIIRINLDGTGYIYAREETGDYYDPDGAYVCELYKIGQIKKALINLCYVASEDVEILERKDSWWTNKIRLFMERVF